jgi:hypothetical protein
MEFLRSTLIEVEVLTGEVLVNLADARQTEVVKRMRNSSEGGLTVCSEIFAML